MRSGRRRCEVEELAATSRSWTTTSAAASSAAPRRVSRPGSPDRADQATVMTPAARAEVAAARVVEQVAGHGPSERRPVGSPSV